MWKLVPCGRGRRVEKRVFYLFVGDAIAQESDGPTVVVSKRVLVSTSTRNRNGDSCCSVLRTGDNKDHVDHDHSSRRETFCNSMQHQMSNIFDQVLSRGKRKWKWYTYRM